MGRKKFFGRSKEGKNKVKRGQQSVPDRNSLDSSLSERQKDSPLLVAKTARNVDLSTRVDVKRQDALRRENSNSSGTVFIPVKDESYHSLESMLSTRTPSSLHLGKAAPQASDVFSPLQLGESHDSASYQQQQATSSNNNYPADVINSPRSEVPNYNLQSTQPPLSFMDPTQFMNMSPPNIFILPPVRIALGELFAVIPGDFHGCERALQLLRDCLENEGMDIQAGLVGMSYDPEEVFMCIRHVADQYHLLWTQMETERNKARQEKFRQRLKKEEESKEVKENELESSNSSDFQGGKDNVHAKVVVENNSAEKLELDDEDKNSGVVLEDMYINDDDWNDLEETIWCICELAVLCCSLLASLCVGPAWHQQIKDRRISVQLTKFDRLRRSQSFQSTAISAGSSATPARRGNNPHRQSTLVSLQEEQSTATSNASSSPIIHPIIQERDEPQYPIIPQALPISMLAFAASFGERILPPVKTHESMILLNIDEDNEICEEVPGSRERAVDLKAFAKDAGRLLWEEQRWLIRRQRLGEAQRELVAALLVGFYEDLQFDDLSIATPSVASGITMQHQKRRYSWSIPGAHAPVATMIRGWAQTALEGWPQEPRETFQNSERIQIINSDQIKVPWDAIADCGAIDWWHSFQVTKSISDLISTGWRPPPEGRDAEESISQIMALAKRAILLSPKDMKADVTDTRAEAREERLAAVSSATEAIGALGHLGSRGCLPRATVKSLSRTLCHMLALTDASISDLLEDLFPLAEPSSVDEENELREELNTFIMQRESCLNEIAELLWSMLARSSSMSSTADTLLRVTDVNLLVEQSNVHGISNDVFAACGAVRSLGASLWGNPPLAKGIPSLRLCWSLFLDGLAEVSSKIHDTTHCQASPLEKATSLPSSSSLAKSIEGPHDLLGDKFTTIPLIGDVSNYHSTSLVFILETAVAIRRLVEGDMISGVDILSVHEWEPLLCLLEYGLLPWLANFHSVRGDQGYIEGKESHHFDRNTALVERIQSEVVMIFDQLKVYLSCNQDGTISFHRIIDESVRNRFYLLFFRMVAPVLPRDDSAMVALSIIDSWVCGGGISCSAHEWHRKCSSLLGEAFAFYEDETKGYEGGYVHSPLIRRAAMRALIESDLTVGPNQPENSSMSTPSGSMDVDPNLVIRNARSIHTDSICKVVLRYLKEVLLDDPTHHGLQLPNPHPTHPALVDYEEQDTESNRLLLSAVQITGDLLRSPSLERRDRLALIDLLGTFVLDTSPPHKCSSPNGLLGDVLKLNDWGDICQVKLESVRQLGLYLRSCFDSLSQAHPSVPHVINVLVTIIKTFYNHEHHPSATLSFQVVSMASLFQLSCLRLGQENKAIIISESTSLSSLPENLVVLMGKMNFVMETISLHDNVDDIKVLENYKTHQSDASRAHVTSSTLTLVITDPKEGNISEGTRNIHTRTIVDLRSVVDMMKEILSTDLSGIQGIQSSERSQYLTFIAKDCTSVLREIKALCYEILQNFITCGLVKRPFDQWCELSECIESDVMSLSRCKVLCTYAAFVEKNDSDRSQNSLFKEIIAYCSSNDIPTLAEACRGLSVSLSTISGEDIELREPFKLWHQEACLALIANLQSHVDKMAGTISEWKGTSIAALLLSTLLHVISTYSPKVHFISDRTKATIVILCHQICAFVTGYSPETYLLSLQCVANAVSFMGIDELGNLMSLIAKRRQSISPAYEGEGISENLQFANMILDLLVQHCLSRSEEKHRRRGGYKEHQKSPVSLSCIELVANDIEDIESFEVDEYNGFSIGAWLCNDLLLVCRVASDDSRHRGWVEITQRSPSTRVRKLVRLSGRISLKSPNVPSKIWEALLPPQDNQHDLSQKQLSICEHDEVVTVDTRSVALAKEAIRRHRKIFHRRRRQQSAGSSIHSSLQSQSLRTFMGWVPDDIHDMKKIGPPTNLDNPPSEIKYGSTKTTSEHESMFRPFLYKALRGDERNLKEVESVLHDLDGSISLLDSVYDLSDEPKSLKWNPKLRRALNILDRTAFLQTHKIALMFAGPLSGSQSSSRGDAHRTPEHPIKGDNWILNESRITPLFSKFCKGLGSLTNLKHLRIFSGGLDTSDYFSDGKFALCWLGDNPETHDSDSNLIGRTMVLFHAVPLMPPGVNNRKRHVGNDVVHIVFVEDPKVDSHGTGAGVQVISGEFCFVTIFVTPTCDNTVAKVTLQLKEGLEEKVKDTLKHLEGTSVMPFDVSPIFVRQLAIRSDLACRSAIQDRLGLFSNWQERLQQIRSLERYAEPSLR